VLTLISQLHRLCDMTEAILALPEKRRSQFAMKAIADFCLLKIFYLLLIVLPFFCEFYSFEFIRRGCVGRQFLSARAAL